MYALIWTERTYAEINVQRAKSLMVSLRQLPVQNVLVGEQTVVVVGFGDDSKTLLDGPAEQDLSRGCAKVHLTHCI